MGQASVTDYTLAVCTIISIVFSLITLSNTIRRNSDNDYNEVRQLVSDNKAGAQLRQHPINSPLNETLIRKWINSKVARYYSPFGNILANITISLSATFSLLLGSLTIISLFKRQYIDFFIGLTFFAVVILATAIILNLPFFTDEITIERQMYIDYLSNIGIKQHNLIQRSFPMFSRKHPASLHFDSLNLQSRIKLLEQMREFANQQSLNDEWINKQIEETNNELDKKLILLKEKYPDAFCALKFISNQETFSDQPHQFIHTPKTTENEVQTSE